MVFYHIVRAICNGLLSLFYSIKFIGKENIPSNGQGCLIICNHQSYLDPPLLGLRLRKVCIGFMAKKSLFDVPLLGLIIRNLGAFPVDRGRNSTMAIDNAIEKVKQGHLVALFPEGTRSKTGELLPHKSGAAVIVAATGADVLPVSIRFKNNRRRFRTRITVRYGKLIKNEKIGITKASSRVELREARDYMQEKVAELYNSDK